MKTKSPSAKGQRAGNGQAPRTVTYAEPSRKPLF